MDGTLYYKDKDGNYEKLGKIINGYIESFDLELDDSEYDKYVDAINSIGCQSFSMELDCSEINLNAFLYPSYNDIPLEKKIKTLRKRIKYCKNLNEKKMLQQELDELRLMRKKKNGKRKK